VDKFWELLERSILVQGTVTLALIATFCYMTAVGREVPEGFEQILILVVGFWFGTYSQKAVHSFVSKIK